MRCHEARQFLGAYLDSELTAETSREIGVHLESCPDCARVFATEQQLDRRIFGELRKGERTPSLWNRVEAQIPTSESGGWRRWIIPFPAKLVALASAACVMLAVGLYWTGHRTLDLAAEAEKHHRAYVDHVMQAEFSGAVPPEIARQLDDRLDAEAFSMRPSAGSFTIAGARLCHISGAPIAWILGRSDDVPVSLLVIKKSQLDHFPMLQRRLEPSGNVLCCSAGLYQFAAKILDEHVVCVIGNRPRLELEALLKSVRKQV